jgi:4-alpha-glucanotransferase
LPGRKLERRLWRNIARFFVFLEIVLRIVPMALTPYQRLFSRAAGILAHVTSLPSRFGIGDLGKSSFQFVDFLAAANQRLWQVLPLTPTGYGNSPYYSYSAMAGNMMLLSPDVLCERGFLNGGDLEPIPDFSEDTVDYSAVAAYKTELFEKAFANFAAHAPDSERAAYENFCATNASWLEDFSLFVALKEQKYDGQPWDKWEKADRLHEQKAMDEARETYRQATRMNKFLQYEFAVQWSAVRTYANSKGVALIGDIPIFIAYDSADVWSKQTAFRLDEDGFPTHVSGVPPDFFSETGQLWGNPHYNWSAMQKDNFSWWGDRFAKCFELYDIVRVDHFRGFEAFWEVEFGAPDAINGKWVPAPGKELFTAMQQRFGERFDGELPIIAEDLGIITPAVTALRKQFNMPGMKILQFGYGAGDPADPFLPHNYEPDSVVYTGTHDNDTTLGWFRSIDDDSKRNALEYLQASSEQEVVWEMIRAAYLSTALFAIVPVQDILTQGTEHRMNFPGKADGNWAYRLKPERLNEWHISILSKFARISNRLKPVEITELPLESTL